MKTLFDTKVKITAFTLSVLHIVLYFGLGAPVFKNMWYTSPAIPVCGAIIAFIPLALFLINCFLLRRNFVNFIVTGLAPCLSLGHFFVFLFILSKLTYFFIEGVPYFITFGLLLLTAFFVFLFPKLSKPLKQITAISISVLLFIICLVCLFGATPFYIRSGATVFAVDDEYQIAFATSHKSAGQVEIDGKIYYDETNGQNNISTLHKICVPKDVLDGAKSYSVSAKSVSVNSAYLPSDGRTVSASYSFRPADLSDGLQIYNLSDTHECTEGPARAGSYFGDKLDLLILNGDIINDVSSEYQISLIYKLAYKITKGSVPVIYTRGNHECNGKLANVFGKYVGCAERGFYYNLTYGNLTLTVLDTANDMADTNRLIRPVANFDEVRFRQSEWLEENDWSNEHNIVIAHMAYPLSGYVKEGSSWGEWARELVSLTDGKTSLAVCGHSHRTVFENAGSKDNAIASYPVLRGSIRSNKYADKEGISPFEFTGTAIEINGNTADIKFTNAKGEIKNSFSLEI